MKTLLNSALLVTGLFLACRSAEAAPLWDAKVRASVSPTTSPAVGDLIDVHCQWSVDMVSASGGNHEAVYTGRGSITHSFQGRHKEIYVTALLGNKAAFEGKPFQHRYRIDAEGQHAFECHADFGAMKESTLANNKATVVVSTARSIAPREVPPDQPGARVSAAIDPMQARPAVEAPAGRVAPPQSGSPPATAAGTPQIGPARTLPQPSASAPVAAGSPQMASGSISGQVRFDEFCRPSINQFAMAINGAPPKSGSFSIQEGSAQSTVTVAGIKLGTTAGRVYDYQFKSLAPGNYQISAAVNPKLLSCPAAEWEPSSISVTLMPTAMNAANRHLAHQTRIEERRIHGGVLAASIEGAAKGTTAKLHNYGPRHDNSWYAKDKSVITLGPGLGGMTLTFGFGEAVQEPWRYYVRDVHLASLDASLTASQIRLRLRFEEEGEELKGHCATDNYAYKTLCLIGDDKAAPDVDMSNIWLDLLFTPGVDDKGRVVVVASTADFNADLQAQGVCNAVDICNLLTGYKTNVEQAVDKAVVGLVQDPVVMTSVSNALAAAMLKLKIGRALSAQVDNGDLVVRHIPQKQ